MKKIILSFIVIWFSMTAFAQSLNVATLSHGDSIKAFMGNDAFIKVMEIAQPGDIINLSSGSFQAPKIDKPVTIRGAGAGVDINSSTIVLQNCTINVPVDTFRFSCEGVRFSNNVEIEQLSGHSLFMKCWFYNIFTRYGETYPDDIIYSCSVINCIVANEMYFGCQGSISFFNSYLGRFNNSGYSQHTNLTNCVFVPKNNDVRNFDYCLIQNSIFCAYTFRLLDNTVAYNSVMIGYNCSNPASYDNVIESKYSDVFATFDGSYNNSETFQLNESAATTLLGNDGTQVGMYGGMFPFSFDLSYPIFTKFDIAKKATADGKLSVDIEVNTAE